MKFKLLALLTLLSVFLVISTTTSAAPKNQLASALVQMSYTTWDPGCEHTMNTNHFDLAPGQSVEIDLDLTLCYAEKLGGLLYWGYYTTRNSSNPLSGRNNIRLTLIDNTTGYEVNSDDGSLFTEASNTTYSLFAENMNARKTIKLRLRSSSGL